LDAGRHFGLTGQPFSREFAGGASTALTLASAKSQAAGTNVSSLTIGSIIFALIFGSALAAIFVRNLPQSHLSAGTQDVVRLSIGLIATMSALVLSLLIASAKSGFDMRRNHLVELSADIVLLDRELAHYGPETKEARALLQQSVASAVERVWPAEGGPPTGIAPATSPIEVVYDKIEALSPQNETQRTLRSQGLSIVRGIDRTEVLLFGNLARSIPVPFLVILVFWLCIIFASFGLFAPRNPTVIVVLCVCALSVSGAIFLILELDRSIGGLLQVSGAPLRAALSQLGR
jgi:hypothetical protein